MGCDSGDETRPLGLLTHCRVEESLARDSVGCPTAGPTASMGGKCCPSMSRCHCVCCRGETGDTSASQAAQPIPGPESVGMRDAGFPRTTPGPVHLAP